ncbi:MAG TPA: hypothetical protein VFZ77_11020 [Acidimicrobiales bacterium]
MLHNDLLAKSLVEDRQRELRHRIRPRPNRQPPPRRRWTRPGRR